MTQDQREKTNIGPYFAKAVPQERFLTPEERYIAGARVFKRRALGILGHESIKTLDEMAQLLHAVGMASSQDEGKSVTQALMGNEFEYDPCSYLSFQEVSDDQGNVKYRIRAGYVGPR